MAFENFKLFIPDFYFGTTFICDFEVGEINATKNIFIINCLSLQLCYFHFVKAIKTYLISTYYHQLDATSFTRFL